MTSCAVTLAVASAAGAVALCLFRLSQRTSVETSFTQRVCVVTDVQAKRIRSRGGVQRCRPRKPDGMDATTSAGHATLPADAKPSRRAGGAGHGARAAKKRMLRQQIQAHDGATSKYEYDIDQAAREATEADLGPSRYPYRYVNLCTECGAVMEPHNWSRRCGITMCHAA